MLSKISEYFKNTELRPIKIHYSVEGKSISQCNTSEYKYIVKSRN